MVDSLREEGRLSPQSKGRPVAQEIPVPSRYFSKVALVEWVGFYSKFSQLVDRHVAPEWILMSLLHPTLELEEIFL